MKKATAVLLALLLTLAYAGCGSGKTEPTESEARPYETYAPSARPTTAAQTATSAPKPTPEPTRNPTPEPEPTQNSTPEPEPTPEPTPWPVERHWWLYTVTASEGLMASSNRFYNRLWANYLVFPQDGVVIGRIKGHEQYKIYTKDPEERVIWLPEIKRDYDSYYANYVRSDVTLPEPDILGNTVYMAVGGMMYTQLSDSAKAMLANEIERIKTEGKPVLTASGAVHLGTAGSVPFNASTIELQNTFVIRFEEIQGLGYMLPYRLIITNTGDFYFVEYSVDKDLNDVYERYLAIEDELITTLFENMSPLHTEEQIEIQIIYDR